MRAAQALGRAWEAFAFFCEGCFARARSLFERLYCLYELLVYKLVESILSCLRGQHFLRGLYEGSTGSREGREDYVFFCEDKKNLR